MDVTEQGIEILRGKLCLPCKMVFSTRTISHPPQTTSPLLLSPKKYPTKRIPPLKTSPLNFPSGKGPRFRKELRDLLGGRELPGAILTKLYLLPRWSPVPLHNPCEQQTIYKEMPLHCFLFDVHDNLQIFSTLSLQIILIYGWQNNKFIEFRLYFSFI